MNAWDLAKASGSNIILDWARSMKIVSYGVVREVLDKTLVRCAYTVQQSDLSEQQVDVTLLSLSSPLFALDVMPLVGDQVLILGLDAWSDKILTGGVEQVKGTKQGYNNQTCVGLLLRTVRMGSAFLLSVAGEDNPAMSFTAGGAVSAAIMNDVQFALVSGDGEEHPVQVDVLENRPVTMRVMSSVQATYGGDITLSIGKDLKGESTSANIAIELDEESELKLTSKSGAEITLDKDFNLTVSGDMKITVSGNAEV